MANATCSVAQCDRETSSRGLCNTHYERLRTVGSVQADKPIVPRLRGVPNCQAEGCSTIRIEARGYCRKHYQRLMKRGDLADRPRGVAEANPKWIGDAAGYRAVHTRLRKAYGRAATHSCVDCERQAEEWSYDHSDPNEGYDERGCPFSTDLTRYQPRCRKCHTAFDEKLYKMWEKRRA